MKASVKRNSKRRLLKEWEWRRLKHDLYKLADNARYSCSAFHKLNPANYGLPQPWPSRRANMLCDRDGGLTNLREALELLQKGLRFGLVDERKSGNGWPLNVWGVWNDIVFEGHWGNNGAYHGYPLQDDDPMLTKIREACNARNYK